MGLYVLGVCLRVAQLRKDYPDVVGAAKLQRQAAFSPFPAHKILSRNRKGPAFFYRPGN